MTSPPSDTFEVELDSRQRLPLARIVQGSQHRFRVIKLSSGDLLISPVVSLTERELAMLQNPKARASLAEGLEQAAKGEVVRHPAGYYERLDDELGPEDEDS